MHSTPSLPLVASLICDNSYTPRGFMWAKLDTFFRAPRFVAWSSTKGCCFRILLQHEGFDKAIELIFASILGLFNLNLATNDCLNCVAVKIASILAHGNIVCPNSGPYLNARYYVCPLTFKYSPALLKKYLWGLIFRALHLNQWVRTSESGFFKSIFWP